MPDGRPAEIAAETPARTVAGTAGDARLEDILAQARRAFVEKGLEGASMKDLALAAGMSAGNFYRYFPSKEALVEALIARKIIDAKERFLSIDGAPDPVAALRRSMCEHIEQHGADADPLWAEITAAASRRPEVAVLLQQMEESMLDLLARIIAVVRRMPEEEARRRFGVQARMVMLILRGWSVRWPSQAAGDADLKAQVLRMLNGLLDELLAAPREPQPPAHGGARGGARGGERHEAPARAPQGGAA